MKNLTQIKFLNIKNVGIRVDFNVPVTGSRRNTRPISSRLSILGSGRHYEAHQNGCPGHQARMAIASHAHPGELMKTRHLPGQNWSC